MMTPPIDLTNNTKTLLLATTNEGKRQEIQTFFENHQIPIHVIIPTQLNDVEETGTTFLANAHLKARAAITNPTSSNWVMAEDSGFSIPALDGQYGHSPFPGIQSNRWMTPPIRAELLGINSNDPVIQPHLSAGIYALIEKHQLTSPINAQYHCAMVVLNKQTGECLFETEETTQLTIVPQGTPAGPHGFGYDPITCPSPEELTGIENVPPYQSTSDLPTNIKNQFSHRAKALQAFLKGR